jgi:deoxycytidine triphosphate deaminase
MQIVDYDRYRVLIKKKTLHCSSCTHLDGLRIGLRIKKNIIRAPSVIKDLENIESQNWDKLNTETDALEKFNFYLGITHEKFSLPENIFGIIHSRSIFARVGLDCVQSSFFVTPGFGRDKPLPLVLELFPKISIKIDTTIPLAGLLLFECENNFKVNVQNLESLFPLLNEF